MCEGKTSIGGFHVTSSLECWWTKTKYLSFIAPLFVHQQLHIAALISVSLEIGSIKLRAEKIATCSSQFFT